MHIGNLLALLSLNVFRAGGYRPILLVGGATGQIGDPTDRTNERPVLDTETVQQNLMSISTQIRQLQQHIAENAHFCALAGEEALPLPEPLFLNNSSFYEGVGLVEFLTRVGRHVRVAPMLARDSVHKRLEAHESLTLSELTYQVIQGYDFCYMREQHNCVMQLGGSDQWGNIVAGVRCNFHCNHVDVVCLGQQNTPLPWYLARSADGMRTRYHCHT